MSVAPICSCVCRAANGQSAANPKCRNCAGTGWVLPRLPRPLPEPTPVPPRVASRNAVPLRCYYCDYDLKHPTFHGVVRGPTGGVRPLTRDGSPASLTVHDLRGCYHVCFGHAQWRLTTSFSAGHSPDCPYHEEAR